MMMANGISGLEQFIESANWGLLAGFVLSVLVLEFFDISLPRGDTLGVSGAVDSAAIIALGPVAASVVGILGTALAFGARRGAERHTTPGIEMPALVAAFSAAIIVNHAAGPHVVGTPLYFLFAFLTVSAYLATELVVVQALIAHQTSRSILRLIRGNLVRQAPLLAAQLSAAILALIILPYIGSWGLALVVVLLLLIRQSYAMLLDIRETYRTTVEVLVEAAEGQDVRRCGHSERTAEIAREIGVQCGLTAREVERVSYAALLHDIDALGGEIEQHECRPSAVLDGVRSFEDVARVLQLIEGTQTNGPPSELELLEAYVVALASDIDAAEYRELRGLHRVRALDRLGAVVPRDAKARAVAAAVRLGHRVPAVS